MDIKIRQENTHDKKVVYELIKTAFEKESFSDHDEHNLVERLRKSNAFIPELSIVAICKDKIVGHILFSKIKVSGSTLLALAPLSVLPKFQKRGIGSKLIEEGHKIAKRLGYKGIIVLGHEHYYPRFGYIYANNYGIKAPFDVEDKYFMALELEKGSLYKIKGRVEYPKEFFEK